MNCPTCGSDCEYIPLANRMRAARMAKGMTQPALAEKLGFDLTTIKRWEYGMHTPSPKSAQVIELWLNKRRDN